MTNESFEIKDFEYPLKDFLALMQVANNITPALKQTKLPQKRHNVGAAYCLFIFSISHALACLVSDENELSPTIASGIPRVPPLAVLTRQLLEAFAWFRFFTISPESDEEADFRFLIANICIAYNHQRDAKFWVEEFDRIEKSGRMEATPEEHQQQLNDAMHLQGKATKTIKSRRNELKVVSFLKRLCKECQQYWVNSDLTKGWGPFRDAVFEHAKLGRHIREFTYDELSSFAHAAPSALIKSFEKNFHGFGLHTQYFVFWAGCLTFVIQYALNTFTSCNNEVTSSERNSINECCDHYPQFLQGKQGQNEAVSNTDECPTCWLRKSIIHRVKTVSENGREEKNACRG